MDPKSYELRAAGNQGEDVRVEITIISERPAVLRAQWGQVEAREYAEYDLFQCLLALRTDLESQDLLLCCQGARKNVSPSGQLRDWSNGRQAYLLQVGRLVSDEDVVDVFSPADCSDVGSIADQKAEIARIRPLPRRP